MSVIRGGRVMGGGGNGAGVGAISVDMLPDIAMVPRDQLYRRRSDQSLWTRGFTVTPAMPATDASLTSAGIDTILVAGHTWYDVETVNPYPADDAGVYFNSNNNTFYLKRAGSLAGSITTGNATYASQYNFRGTFATPPNLPNATNDIYYNTLNGNWYRYDGTNYVVVADPGSLFDETNPVIWFISPIDTEAEVLERLYHLPYSSDRDYAYYDMTADAIRVVETYTATTTDWAASDFESVTTRTGTITIYANEAAAFTDLETNGYVAANNYGFVNTAGDDFLVVTDFTDATPFVPAVENPFWAPVSQDLVRGPSPNQFADATARDAALTGATLVPYENNPLLLIGVGTRVQRYVNSAWQQVDGWIVGEQGPKGDQGDSDEYYVIAANVTQANGDITLDIPGITTVPLGMNVIFDVKSRNTMAGARLQINALGFNTLLKQDKTAFEIVELETNSQISAIWNGTAWVSDVRRTPPLHSVGTDEVTNNGNDISLTDNTIRLLWQGRIVVEFPVEFTNDGDVRLQIISSNFADRQFLPLLRVDGSQIAPGELSPGMWVRAIFDTQNGSRWLSDIVPPRSLRGALLATANIPVGTHPEGTVFPWAVESGITYLSTATLPANYIRGNAETDNGIVLVPLTRGDRVSQLGWYVEIVNGTTVVFEKLYEFNEYSFNIEREITTSDGLNVSITYWQSFPGISPMHIFVVAIYNLTSTDEVVAAGNTYQVRLYLSEN